MRRESKKTRYDLFVRRCISDSLTKKQLKRFHALAVKEAVGKITHLQLCELERLDAQRQ